MAETLPGQVDYIHHADVAPQIDENNQMMPNIDGVDIPWTGYQHGHSART